MKFLSKQFFLFFLLTMNLAFAEDAAKKAPEFSLPDQEGKTRSLKDFKGKYVVLEWYNKGCPFVKKFYENGKMQELQKEFTQKGVVWLSIISSAPGKQGHMAPDEIKAEMKERGSAPTAVLRDEKGDVGKLYEAKTTPQMVIINPKQEIIYEGAIDDKPDTDADSLKDARNYVQEALQLALNKKEVKVKRTQSYGCSVKYM